MNKILLVLVGSLWVGTAWAQSTPNAPGGSTVTPAPAAGSGGGGSVGASASTPTHPTGKTPPGTPSAATPAGRIARDTTGQKVIGHTATTGSIPGNTGGASTGVK